MREMNMDFTVYTKAFPPPPINKTEILRYAGCKGESDDVLKLLNGCFSELADTLTYKVCYCVIPLNINDGVCDFGVFKVKSQSLALNMNGCNSALVFAATIGVEIDRLITKYGYLSPAKALMFQAIGAERIEALCDAFCNAFAQESKASLSKRFSPGYGDLPLDIQKQIFSVLNCPKHIGLTLNESLLMSPSKSVTAFIGIKA